MNEQNVCKYCGVEFEIKLKTPPLFLRKLPACQRCKWKHYRDTGGETYRQRKNESVRGRYSPESQAAWFQRFKEEKPELYKARIRRNNRSLSGRFIKAKSRAKRTNVEWTITKEEFAKILEQPCFYCHGHLNDTGSGIDRKEAGGCYSIENSVPCCATCNKIKTNLLTSEEMLVAMKAVLKLREIEK